MSHDQEREKKFMLLNLKERIDTKKDKVLEGTILL